MKFSRFPAPDLLRPPFPPLAPVHFRLATKADLHALHRACFASESLPDFAARFDSSLRLQEAGRLLHVLAVDDQSGLPVASGQLISYTETIAEIADLVVTAAVRGRGVGTALVRVLGALAADAGARRLELSVRVGNAGALALYRRLGFRANRLLHFPSGERAVLLARAPWAVPVKEEADEDNRV